MVDHAGSQAILHVGDQDYTIFPLERFPQAVRLPYALKILLENLLRHEEDSSVRAEDIQALASWQPQAQPSQEIAFMPARVLLQDFTGVPAVVDLAAMREAMRHMGGDPRQHQSAVAGRAGHRPLGAGGRLRQPGRFPNQRRAGAGAEPRALRLSPLGPESLPQFSGGAAGHRHRPPGQSGISGSGDLHQPRGSGESGPPLAYPDTVVGTDSHTTMINGLGVLGWGVGGIEAEAAMLGQPLAMLLPQVVGFRLHGRLREGATATDLVLTVTEMLRKKGVVGKFVEFFGEGLAALPVADRATIANMAPEYGATCGIFPVDAETLRYLRFSGRPESLVRLVEAYCKEQGLYHTAATPEAVYSDTVELDLAAVEPSLAGPRRPQDRVPLSGVKKSWAADLANFQSAVKKSRPAAVATPAAEPGAELQHGSVVIAAITSCTNTSNPSVMLAAGLLARKAVERGLSSRPWVKTSLAPGSKVVTDYLAEADLIQPLEQLGFHLVGYGCTTCIGNSGPLPPAVSKAIEEHGLVVAAVLSGNRNFEGRIHAEVRANYLSSPPLVVAYALAGRIDIDLAARAAGHGSAGSAGVPARSLADSAGSQGRRASAPFAPRCSTRNMAPSSRATSTGRPCLCPKATSSPGTRLRPTSSIRRTSWT